MAAEKYLLNELTPDEREEFEDHYFTCTECAAGLRAAEAFLEAAKQQLATTPAPSPARAPAPLPKKKSLFDFLWTPAFTIPAFALLLLVIAYQSGVVYPRLHSQLAQLETPQLVMPLSLAAGNSRGGETPSLITTPAQTILLTFDIPAQDRFSNYTCLLYAPSGSVIARILVSAQQAKDTVSISIPAANRTAGRYTLLIQGNQNQVTSDSNPAQPAAADLAHYRFDLKN